MKLSKDLDLYLALSHTDEMPRLRRWKEQATDLEAANATLREQLAEREADGERLDWLENEANDTPIMKMSDGTWYWFTDTDIGWTGGTETVREVIDAAIDSARQAEGGEGD